MNVLESALWAGTRQSFLAYQEGEKQISTLMTSKLADQYNDDEDNQDDPSRLLNKTGNVAVVTIAGTLVNSDSWMNEYMGRTGYPEIRQAMIQAASDPDVGTILLDFKSGGGQAAGVSDAADLIKMIDQKVKPVHAFCDSTMGSAAYWLGSGARSISIGRVAEVGSIGVLQIHKEMSKALEMEGVKVTVVKSGEFKALGNAYEPLTAKMEAEIQSQVDYVSSLFTQTVAENRGVTYPEADKKMGQGKVFIGQQAVDVGLADSLTTFDSVMSKLQGEIDIKKDAHQYGGNFQKGSAMKHALTDQQLAVMAVTGNLALAEGVKPTAPAEDKKEAAAPAQDKPEEVPETKAEAAKPEQSDLVSFLKTSLAEAQASVVDLTVQLRDVKASADKSAENHSAMRAIAEASVSQLKIALGLGATGMAGATDSALLAEHATLRAQFESKFKAGGVAAVSSSDSADSTKVSEAADPIRQARLASTRTV